jgi:hypothetical protein
MFQYGHHSLLNLPPNHKYPLHGISACTSSNELSLHFFVEPNNSTIRQTMLATVKNVVVFSFHTFAKPSSGLVLVQIIQVRLVD